ncbi:MAG TPA: prepilin-type N-terminal cleavage/methylation domain-containing protein [Gammaproteobacteria bacterium]|nr:prepilin-type N-terminal cleavage/methylation domain-containing protein [Gammaproteobacteria bacterium]
MNKFLLLKIRFKPSCFRQQGLTLIELMVALVISLIILAGLYTVYSSNKMAYQRSSGMAQVQENGRFTLDFLTRSIRLAGFPSDNPDVQKILFGDATEAANLNSSNNANVAGHPNNTIANGLGDDRLVIHFGDSTATLPDCLGAVPAPPDTTRNIFEVRNSGRTNTAGNAIYSLFCNNQELVEGIENLQVLYGLDTDYDTNPDGIANQYVTLDDIPPHPQIAGQLYWDQVVSVKLAVLATSVDELSIAPSNRSFPMLDIVIPAYDGGAGNNPADRIIRRVYTTTVLLRNHKPRM